MTSVPLTASQEETVRRARDIVEFLSLEIGERNYLSYINLERSAAFIKERFQGLGYSVTMAPYTLGKQTFHNIIAEKTSMSPKGGVLIVGAHYDSCFNPGADDNASGIAGLLELARLLKDEDLKNDVRFIAFTNEEPPFFMTEDMGSRVYAKAAKKNSENIRAVVILEMLGYYSEDKNSQEYLPLMGLFYPNHGNFIGIVGNFPSRHIASGIQKTFKKHGTFQAELLISPSFVPAVNYSDHWSFWKEGYAAVMITDTAFLRNPNYHKASDLPGTLDYKKMAQVIHNLKYSIMELANKTY